MAEYLTFTHLVTLYSMLSAKVLDIATYLFDGKVEAGKAILILYSLTVFTKIFAQTRLYLIEVEGLTPPIAKKVLYGILTCKAWVPGYLNLNYLENKGLLRWLIYSLLLVIGRQLEYIHPSLQDVAPDLIILLLGIHEVRSILKNLEESSQEWAGVGRQMIDDFFGPLFKRFLDGILAFLGSRASYTSTNSGKSETLRPEESKKAPTSAPKDK